MNIRWKTFTLYLWILASISLHGSNEDRLFYDAVRAEANGDLDLAIQHYIQASKTAHSSNLHGNLANLFFKKEQYGKSILHFKKALLLNPKNSELSANLNFAYEMANVTSKEKKLKYSYFSKNFLTFWTTVTILTFWLGLLFFIYAIFFRANKKSIFYLLPSWILLIAVFSYASYLSYDQRLMLDREIIVYQDYYDNNKSDKVELKRFAGETATVNTSVPRGESLYVDLENDGTPKSHQISDGKMWYLVRSLDEKKKGWISESEFGWVIEPKNI